MTKRQGNRARNLTVFGVVIVAAVIGIGSLNNRPARQPVSVPTLATRQPIVAPTMALDIATATMSDFAQTLVATTPQNVRATWAAGTADALQATRNAGQVARPTRTPAPTLSAADQIDATGEAAEGLIQQTLAEMPGVLAVNRIGSATYGDSGLQVDVWLDVRPEEMTLEMAQRVYAVIERITGPLARAQVNFETDGRIQRSWVWTASRNDWREFDAGGAPVQTNTPAGETRLPTITALPITIRSAGVQCPANCTEAVALGWTARQAARCSHLDRDGDGVACYGD